MSVRSSHTLVFCRSSWIIIKLVSPWGGHTILVFPYETVWQYSDRDPLTGASSTGGHGTAAIFGQYLGLSRKWYTAIVTMETIAKLSDGTNFSDLEWHLTQISWRWFYLTSSNSKMVQNRAILTMADHYKVIQGLVNGAFFSDREQPLTQISRSCHYLTLYISETVRDTDIVSMEY